MDDFDDDDDGFFNNGKGNGWDELMRDNTESRLGNEEDEDNEGNEEESDWEFEFDDNIEDVDEADEIDELGELLSELLKELLLTWFEVFILLIDAPILADNGGSTEVFIEFW